MINQFMTWYFTTISTLFQSYHSDKSLCHASQVACHYFQNQLTPKDAIPTLLKVCIRDNIGDNIGDNG